MSRWLYRESSAFTSPRVSTVAGQLWAGQSLSGAFGLEGVISAGPVGLGSALKVYPQHQAEYSYAGHSTDP